VRTLTWRALALLLCALFLASVAGYYHRGFGFTALLGLPKGHDYELPEMQALRQIDYEGTGYDAQYYVQLALRPSLRNRDIDRAMDSPPYRARRILFSWTAFAAGLGRPRLIVQVYALQNVVCWLVLAWLITRWIPPETPRLFALWAASMFSHGLLFSVRFSLLDGPSLLLIAIAALAVERGRPWAAASMTGLAGLARETNLLAAVILARRPRGRRPWVQSAGLAALVAVPLIVWQDYLYSIYRTTSLAGGDQLARPFTAFLGAWRLALTGVAAQGIVSPALHPLLITISLTVQTLFLVRTRAWDQPWWRTGAAFAALMMIVSPAVWVGNPGAITRVVLPLTFGFNILLSRETRGFWVWCVTGNLHVLAALHALPLLGIVPPL
jgi:hypothetical protein